jgi:hypothetical protein
VEYKKFRNTVKFAKATNELTKISVLWNSHPQDIRKLQSFAHFRKAVAEYYINKTLYGALTRWGYTNTHITVYDTRYSTQLFQLRSKPGHELSGKVEYERESSTH